MRALGRFGIGQLHGRPDRGDGLLVHADAQLWGLPQEVAAHIADRAPLDTVLSYCRYTLLDRELLRWVPRFADRAIGVINASPLAMGLLSEGGPPAWHPAPAALRERAAQAAELCRRRGTDIAKIALQFAVAPATFATTVVGSANAAAIARNVNWISQPLDWTLLGEVEAVLAPVLNSTWQSGPDAQDRPASDKH